jgi:hypothetical protein
MPPSEQSPDEIGREITNILNGPEYKEPAKPITQRILDWISERMADLIADLIGGDRTSFVVWVVVALVAAGFVYLLYRFVRELRFDPARREAALGDPRRPPEDWLADAAAFEAKGDWRQALRCRYRALVARLAARGLVDEIPGRTAGEYRNEVGANLPSAYDPFSGATLLFEGAWYGGEDITEAQHATFRSMADEVLRSART